MKLKPELPSPKSAQEFLERLAAEFETTEDAVLSAIEAGRRYFVFCAEGVLSRLVRAGELCMALDKAHDAGVDVRTVQIIDLSGVAASLRRAAAAELN